MRRRRATGVPTSQQAVALQAASLLLAYPQAELQDQVPLLRALASRLPEEAGAPLAAVCEHLATSELHVLQAAYTETFDLRRRCCLYLTYFSHGDTRQRGMALLRFSHAYRSAGAEFVGGELPDHLGVVCEFAAQHDLELGLRLLSEQRAGIELVRTALAELASPYTGVLDLVRAVLGEATAADLDRAAALARTGPPEEEVGLEPFGPPELMGGRR